MKKSVLFLCLILLISSFQNCSKKQSFEAGKTITIPYNPDKNTPLDSFISKITIVPLETNDSCLLRELVMPIKQHQGLIYINNFLKQLLVFDMKGNFIREIGKMGEGPGEFINVLDFIFTDDNTIELLDFKKIESYTLEGKHLGTKRFDFMGTDLYLNPTTFTRSFSSGYYLWGGVSGPVRYDEKLREKSSLMYRIDSAMQIEKGYFSTRYGDGGKQNRIKNYQNYILITPSVLDYNVYQIDTNDSMQIRYSFDFGKYGFDNSKEVDRNSISYNDYILSIDNYHETDRFLFFEFNYNNKMNSVLYSKITGQAFFQTTWFTKDFILHIIKTMYNDQLIAFAPISSLKTIIGRMTQENIKKWGLEGWVEKLDDEDNPVMIIYTIKL